MTIKEIIDADVAKWDQQQEQHRAKEIRGELAQLQFEESPNEGVKTNVDSWRNSAIGEIIVNHFPELKCFHPQLNKLASASEFKLFDDFLTEISANKTFRTAMQSMVESKKIEGKQAGLNGPNDTTCKSAH